MYLIFDFDGTLVDSFPNAVEVFNLLAEDYGFRKIKADEIASLKDLNSTEFVKYLKVPIYKIPRVIYRARKEINKKMPELLPFDDIPRVLAGLQEMGFYLGILTSNSRENVEGWLEHNKMRHLFKFIHSESSFFGKGRVLRKICKAYGIDRSKAFYIGDETRDIEAAKQNGMRSIAVTWGFNSEWVLSRCHPEYLARNPEDLLVIFGMMEI